VNALKNAAICAVEELNREVRQIPSNREKISDAEELGRQAWETILGQAEAADKIALDKYHELFALKKRLEARLNQGKALTTEERDGVDILILRPIRRHSGMRPLGVRQTIRNQAQTLNLTPTPSYACVGYLVLKRQVV
jgi:hypothetical protein